MIPSTRGEWHSQSPRKCLCACLHDCVYTLFCTRVCTNVCAHERDLGNFESSREESGWFTSIRARGTDDGVDGRAGFGLFPQLNHGRHTCGDGLASPTASLRVQTCRRSLEPSAGERPDILVLDGNEYDVVPMTKMPSVFRHDFGSASRRCAAHGYPMHVHTRIHMCETVSEQPSEGHDACD